MVTFLFGVEHPINRRRNKKTGREAAFLILLDLIGKTKLIIKLINRLVQR
jgi:hypothetical protein